MAIKTVTSLKSFFEAGDKPSQEEFVDLIDSTYSGEIGAAIVSAVSAGSTGLLQVDSASAVSFVTTGSAGLAVVSANTQASARTAIGAASTSAATTAAAGLIEIATTAEAIAGTNASKAMTPATDAATAQLPRGHLWGLTLSNGTDATNDIDIALGECRSDADDGDISLTSAVGKQLDVSWAAGGTPGTPTGGLSSSLTVTNDTTYHVIAGLVSGTAEIGFDTSITGANLVTDHSFTNTRRIGSVKRLTATNQVFYQDGDEFLIDPVNDFNVTNPGISATLRALSVPVGIQVDAMVTFHAQNAGITVTGLLTSPDQADTAPSGTIFDVLVAASTPVIGDSTFRTVRTDTSAQVRTRVSASGGSTIIRGITHGWIDRRGRDG